MPLPERVLIDTSAFYALVSQSDSFHEQAKTAYERLIDREQELWTNSYVLLETIALIHRRLGFQVLSEFVETVQSNVRVFWVESTLHNEAWQQLTAVRGSGLSFVDWTAVLVSRIIDAPVFTFDSGFVDRGVSVLPR